MELSSGPVMLSFRSLRALIQLVPHSCRSNLSNSIHTIIRLTWPIGLYCLCFLFVVLYQSTLYDHCLFLIISTNCHDSVHIHVIVLSTRLSALDTAVIAMLRLPYCCETIIIINNMNHSVISPAMKSLIHT